MTADQTNSLLWLWVLQIAWWLAAMLPLAAAGILIALGLRVLNRRARAIEKEPVESKPGGFVKLLRAKFTHQALGQSMLLIIFGGLALGGLAGLFLQELIQPGVQKAIESGDLLKQEAAAPTGNGPPLDLIFLLALVVGSVTVVLAVRTYRSLCRRAAELAGSLASPRSPAAPPGQVVPRQQKDGPGSSGHRRLDLLRLDHAGRGVHRAGRTLACGPDRCVLSLGHQRDRLGLGCGWCDSFSHALCASCLDGSTAF